MGYKYMKEEEFNRIKALLDAGVSRGQVVTVTKRSGALIDRVKRCKNWDEYKVILASLAQDRRTAIAKSENRAPIVEVDPEHIRRAGPAIKAITTGFAVGRNRILGLGEDNQVYSFENQEWKEL